MAPRMTQDQLILCQIDLEKTYSNKNTKAYLRSLIGDNDEIKSLSDKLIESLKEYEPNPAEPHELDLVVPILLDLDIAEMVYSVVAFVLIGNGARTSVQAAIGSQIKKLEHVENMNLRLLCLTFIVSAASQFSHIQESVRKGYQTMLWSTFRFNDEVMNQIKTHGKALPSILPLKEIKNNFTSGYHTFENSVLLGGKHHDHFICLSHINKVNSIPYHYEERLREMVEPVFKEDPKVKKDGTWETKKDIEERRNAFITLHKRLPDRVIAIQNYSDVFFLSHAYCTRGRTHVNAEEYNYQGSKFLKGMIDFADQELIEPEW